MEQGIDDMYTALQTTIPAAYDDLVLWTLLH